MFYYLYKVTNQINNRYYIGVRSSTVDPESDPYLGSGKILKQAVKTYGAHNFTKIILETFDNLSLAFNRESEIVTETLLEDPLIYNLVPGGHGGDHWTNLPNKEDILRRKSLSHQSYLNQLTTDERKIKYGNYGKNNGFFNKTHSEKTRASIREKTVKFIYKLISPTGEQFTTNSLNHFCQNYSLNRDTLMYFMGNGIIPPPNGVGPKTNKPNLRNNTAGWSVEKIKSI